MARRVVAPYRDDEKEVTTDYMTELEELYERLKTAKPGKEMREIHKRLRKYGDGIFIWDRYPCYRYVVPILVYIVMLLVFLHMYGAI